MTMRLRQGANRFNMGSNPIFCLLQSSDNGIRILVSIYTTGGYTVSIVR